LDILPPQSVGEFEQNHGPETGRDRIDGWLN
jgi:hypothetical protein